MMMRMLHLPVLQLLLLLSTYTPANANSFCDAMSSSSSSEPIRFSGAPSVQAVAQAWKNGYQQAAQDNNCNDDVSSFDMVLEGASSADGIARVCGTRTGARPVDLGGLSREIYTAEAKVDTYRHYDCERSRRNAILVDVAVEGISLFVHKQGPARGCLEILGGLTSQQLRWMYSNYTREQLVEEGWDTSSVPFEDGDDTTRLWSELHPDCAPIEIGIAGEPSGSLVQKYFVDNVFVGDEEGFADRFYASDNIPELAQYAQSNTAAICFMGLGYTLQISFATLLETLEPVPIQNAQGEYTQPGYAAIEDSAYLLSRRLSMAVLDDEESLARTRPFLDFAFSEQGNELLKASGFWPLHEWESVAMRARLKTRTGAPLFERAQQYCGTPGGSMEIAGSSTVFPLARIWAEIYKGACPEVDITYEGGGSSAGAGRVCANADKGTPVDIGNMSREWKDKEASTVNKDYLYQCLKGDPDRSAFQVSVAVDGLTVAVKRDGTAAQCIERLGGLTIDQLRWVFSSYTDEQLVQTGWDLAALANSDNDSSTHLWSELDPSCAAEEIRISGPDDQSGTYAFFLEEILTDYDNGESFGFDRVLGYLNSVSDEKLVSYVERNPTAIAFFGYAYYKEYERLLKQVPIQNKDGEMVVPSGDTIQEGSYNPLSRMIYMNLLNDKEALRGTAPFVQFGLNSDDLVAVTGYLPVSNKQEMQKRISGAPYSLNSDQDGQGLSIGGIVGIALGSLVICGIIWYLFWRRAHRYNHF